VFYTDLTVRYQLPFEDSHYEVFATVNNLFNKHAPLVYNTVLPGYGLPTIPSLYDVVGQYFTFGIRVRF